MSETTSQNPSVSDEIVADLEVLKGDAIGDTMYSERFVLRLMQILGRLAIGEIQLEEDENRIQQSNGELEDERQLEENLCNLWDMTAEADIVRYMLRHHILDIFNTILTNTENRRLTEIVVGMLGNMCIVPVALQQISKMNELLEILMSLSGCSDTPTLIQLLRFWNLFWQSNSRKALIKCFQMMTTDDSFSRNLCHILKNSCKESLLLSTIELLSIIMEKFDMMQETDTMNDREKSPEHVDWLVMDDQLINQYIIEATLEALITIDQCTVGNKNSSNNDLTAMENDCREQQQQQHQQQVDTNGFDDELASDDYIRAQTNFCKTHHILLKHCYNFRPVYLKNDSKLIDRLQQIHRLHLNRITLINLNYQELFDNSMDVFCCLTKLSPFHDKLMDCLLELWIKYRKIAKDDGGGGGDQLKPDSPTDHDANEENNIDGFEENIDLPKFSHISKTFFELMLYFGERCFHQKEDLTNYVANLKNSPYREELVNMLETQNLVTKEKFSKTWKLLKQGLTTSNSMN